VAEKRKTPSIPSIDKLSDIQLKLILKPIKEIIEVREGRLGSKKDMAVTYQDLVDLGLITESQIPR